MTASSSSSSATSTGRSVSRTAAAVGVVATDGGDERGGGPLVGRARGRHERVGGERGQRGLQRGGARRAGIVRPGLDVLQQGDQLGDRRLRPRPAVGGVDGPQRRDDRGGHGLVGEAGDHRSVAAAAASASKSQLACHTGSLRGPSRSAQPWARNHSYVSTWPETKS